MNNWFKIVLFIAFVSCGSKKTRVGNVSDLKTTLKSSPFKLVGDTSCVDVSNLFENKLLKLTSACFYQFNDSINEKLQQAIGASDSELLQNFEIAENTPLVFENHSDTIVVNYFFINHPDNNHWETKVMFSGDTTYLNLLPKSNFKKQFARNVNRFTWRFIRKNGNDNLKFVLL